MYFPLEKPDVFVLEMDASLCFVKKHRWMMEAEFSDVLVDSNTRNSCVFLLKIICYF